MDFASEYDAYMRPVTKLGRCRFKGGGSHTTTVQQRNIPAQTAREAALESDLYRYSTDAINQSQRYLDRAESAINNLPVYDWNAIQRNYERDTNNALADYTRGLGLNARTYENSILGNNAGYQNRLSILDALSNQAAGSYAGRQDRASNAYQRALAQGNTEYSNAANKYRADQTAASNAYQNALNAATAGNARETEAYQKNLTDLRNAYNAKTANVNRGYDDLLAGKLPDAYAAARRAALKDDLEKSMGSTVSGMANRGILNSSVTNRALNDISQNASDTLAKQYTSDLVTAADLLSRGNSQYENWFKNNAETYGNAYNAGINRYNTAAQNAGNAYNAASGTNKGILDALNNATGARMTNAGNAYNAASGTNKGILDAMRDNLSTQTTNAAAGYAANNATAKSVLDAANGYTKDAYDAKAKSLKDTINVANVTQNAGLALPAAYLGYASQLYSPAQNLYNNMYNGRMGTGTTSSSTSQSGPSTSSQMWGLAGQLGAAAIMCFRGDTLITTPDGYKRICDIKPGDEVYSVSGGRRAIKKVKSVKGPHEAEIVDVTFKDGTVWHTTATQRYFDGLHFHNIRAHGEGFDIDGLRWGIVRVFRTGHHEQVYDFTLEGPRGENVFFAEDMAAEGL